MIGVLFYVAFSTILGIACLCLANARDKDSTSVTTFLAVWLQFDPFCCVPWRKVYKFSSFSLKFVNLPADNLYPT